MKMDNRNFSQVVETIEGAEKDVDRVLGAARLQRHEGPGSRMTAEQKASLLAMLIGCGTFLGVLWILFGWVH